MRLKKFSPFYTNNISKNFNRTMNRIYDIIEKRTYFKEKKKFEARILTGEATDSATDGFFDIVSDTLFGSEETTGFKIRFHGRDKDYNYYPDPDEFSEEEKINIISLHPNINLSIAVSGIAGPKSDDTKKEVGLVYISVSFNKETLCKEYKFGEIGRDNVRLNTSIEAFEISYGLVSQL